MRRWSIERVAAAAAGAKIVYPGESFFSTGRSKIAGDESPGPTGMAIDSRQVRPGDLFVGLEGKHVDGGAFAADVLRAGAWGVLVRPRWAQELVGEQVGRGAVFASERPVVALGALARGWRQELGAQVIAVTGSVGKTSTKDLIATLIRPHRMVAASKQNFNTEVGLPLEILAARSGTEVLVLELATRGFGQISELTGICLPDVGVITNIAPAHLEQFGSLEGVAKAKGELFETLPDGASAIIPTSEPRLQPYLHDGLKVVSFGPGGDVDFDAGDAGGTVVAGGRALELELPFSQRYQRQNALCAVAASLAVGVLPSGRVDVRCAPLRGERVQLPNGAVVINDCYNASPLSMQAAIEDFGAQATRGRRIAVLGDMLELGPREYEYHRAVGSLAADTGVEVLVTVGRRASAMLDTFSGAGEGHMVSDAAEATELLRRLVMPDDLVLVKGSRGMALEVIASTLSSR